jgi:hypothetical protein
MTPEQKSEAGKRGGKKAGQKCKELGVGICGLTFEQRSENAKKINSRKYQCTITGYVSTASGLTRYQRKRGIDPSNRIRIQ